MFAGPFTHFLFDSRGLCAKQKQRELDLFEILKLSCRPCYPESRLAPQLKRKIDKADPTP